MIDTMTLDPRDKYYVREVHSSEGYPTLKLLLYVHLLVDCKFGMCVNLFFL